MAIVDFTPGDFPKNSCVPDATYHLRINGVKIQEPPEDKKTGPNDLVLNVDFVIQDEEQLGRHIFANFPLDPKHELASRTRQLLDKIGYPEDEPLDTDKLVDATVMAVVIAKAGKDGETRNQIRKFLSEEELGS